MDIEFLNDVKNHSHLHTKDIYFEKCPKCSSFSFLNNECQNCNYDANVSLIGVVLGERSFYTLKENLYNSLSDFEKKHPHLFREDSKYKHFLNKVKLRYNDLLDYLYAKENQKSKDRPIFLQELRDIIIELYDAKVDENDIWHPLRDIDRQSSLFNRIREVVLEVKSAQRKSHSFSLDYKFAGILSLSALMFGLMTISIFMCLSLAFFTYYKFN